MSALAAGAVFVDTSALYALYASSDACHSDAAAILRRLAKEGAPLVTTDMVLLESYILVHARTGSAGLLRFRSSVEPSGWLRRLAPSDEQVKAAWHLIEARTDKNYSLVDATSFLVMRALGIRRAFTFDAHFSQERFDVIAAPKRRPLRR